LYRLNRPVLYSVAPLFLGLIISFAGLYLFYIEIDPNENLDELAIGSENTLTLASIDKKKIHCEGGLREVNDCINDYLIYGDSDELILWLGNSQLHSINQFQLGDETASLILHKKLQSKDKYLLTFSQPNANLQEHFLLFEYLSNRVPITELILPVVFDDLRETGIRDNLQDILKHKVVIRELKNTEVGNKILLRQNTNKSLEGHNDPLDGTEQEGVEEYLNNALESMFDIWGDRSALRGKILLNLYKFRNWSLGITPSSIRKKIPVRYNMNMQALSAIIDSAQRKEIKVLVYIVPIRNDVKIPYNLNDYNDFKSKVISLDDSGLVKIANMEGIVPANYWGSKKPTSINSKVQELDFMHFNADGHKALSNEIFKALKAENDF